MITQHGSNVSLYLLADIFQKALSLKGLVRGNGLKSGGKLCIVIVTFASVIIIYHQLSSVIVSYCAKDQAIILCTCMYHNVPKSLYDSLNIIGHCSQINYIFIL